MSGYPFTEEVIPMREYSVEALFRMFPELWAMDPMREMGNEKWEEGCGNISKPDILEWDVGPLKVGSGTQTRIPVFKISYSGDRETRMSATWVAPTWQRIIFQRGWLMHSYLCYITRTMYVPKLLMIQIFFYFYLKLRLRNSGPEWS